MVDLATIGITGASIERASDLGTGPHAVVNFWKTELKLAENEDEHFTRIGRQIISRYRDEREANEGRIAKYNILWSNTEVLKPVLYGRTPKPEVKRRFTDNDNEEMARFAAEIMQRALCYERDIEEFDDVMLQVVEDRLLPGRGVARVFYEYQLGDEEAIPDENEPEETEAEEQAPPPKTFRQVTDEQAPVRYVFWEDYRECPARTEKEIWWKAYRSYLTRDELIDRFGSVGKEVPLDYRPKGVGEKDLEGPLADSFKKASVWEIWDDKTKTVVWVATSYNDAPLDKQDDPLKLPGFFPSPPALRATTTNNKRSPVADYYEYQDQAQELDTLTSRIDRLQRALKVAGVYAGSEKMVLQQLVSDSSENRLIPVEDWAAFAGDKGGVANLIQWLPVEQIANVLLQLYDARERVLRIIYQVTGIADILRGETDAQETLGAQQLKTQFATRRITRAQKDVARFARDLIRLRGCVMSQHFSPDTLRRMSGLPEPLPQLPPAPPMLIPAPQPPAMPQGMPVGGPAPAGPVAGPGTGGMAVGPPGAPMPGGPPPGGGAVVPLRPGFPGLAPGGGAGAPPVAGARLARDGRYYVPDPRRPGNYLMVA